jgi:HSP20 family protein
MVPNRRRCTWVTESTTVPVKKANGKLQSYGVLDELEDEMQRLFRWPLALPPAFFAQFPRVATTKAWAPRMDVYEKEGAIVLDAELPGLKKEDVHVQVMGDDLIISGEARAETEVKEEAFYRSERTFGSFYRRLPLPSGTKADQVEATLTDGVLEVRIPKAAEPKPEPTKVEVK